MVIDFSRMASSNCSGLYVAKWSRESRKFRVCAISSSRCKAPPPALRRRGSSPTSLRSTMTLSRYRAESGSPLFAKISLVSENGLVPCSGGGMGSSLKSEKVALSSECGPTSTYVGGDYVAMELIRSSRI